MNYQSYPKLEDEVLKRVEHLLQKHIHERCKIHDTEYYAYPMTYSSTAGARGGIGGCAMSDFTTHAFVAGSSAVLVCTGVCKFVEKFEPFRSQV